MELTQVKGNAAQPVNRCIVERIPCYFCRCYGNKGISVDTLPGPGPQNVGTALSGQMSYASSCLGQTIEFVYPT